MDLANILPGLTEKTLRRMACAAGLIALGSAGYWAYCRLRRKSDPLTERSQPDANASVSDDKEGVDEASVLQINEPNWQLVTTALPPEEPKIVLCGGRELNSTCQIIQFLSYESRRSQSESVEIKRYFVSVSEGSEIQQWWFTITETCRMNHLGFPYYTTSEDAFTGIQSISGRVSEVVSCRRLETFVNVLLEDCMGSEESHSAEEREVPFISCHLADCGIADVALKLPALREVFSMLFTSIHLQNFLFVSGKELVMYLAALNKQNVVDTQLSYESLMRFLKAPANQNLIELELVENQLQLNILDVLFELILFGWFRNDSAPEFTEGGFLDKLFRHIISWDVEFWEPAANLCFMVLLDQLTAFLELLFSQPLVLYGDIEGLTRVVLGLLKQHVQQLLKAVNKF
ncbi:uncharacterized protein LOC134314566 [Trichomycterus rosablanca]|uniref:uncharacterized protein LOC134314566 n=1 Tax=Trichomycterus rosablanca TaxID=2290929 RepID=UPI002F355EF1